MRRAGKRAYRIDLQVRTFSFAGQFDGHFECRRTADTVEKVVAPRPNTSVEKFHLSDGCGANSVRGRFLAHVPNLHHNPIPFFEGCFRRRVIEPHADVALIHAADQEGHRYKERSLSFTDHPMSNDTKLTGKMT